MRLLRTRRKLAAAETTLRQIVGDYRASLRRNKDLEGQIQMLEAENGALTRDTETLRQRLTGAVRHNGILRDANDGLIRQIASLEADVDAASRCIHALETGTDPERALRLTNSAQPARHAAVAP